jgi:hypothetical protein
MNIFHDVDPVIFGAVQRIPANPFNNHNLKIQLSLARTLPEEFTQ